MKCFYWTRSIEFSAAHFYHQYKWDDNKNKLFFGKCFTKFGHGHDYKLEVSFEIKESMKFSEFEPFCNQAQIEIQKLKDELDHRHLNFDLDFFRKEIPTTENIATYCGQKLRSHLQNLKKIRLYERPDLFVEIEF